MTMQELFLFAALIAGPAELEQRQAVVVGESAEALARIEQSIDGGAAPEGIRLSEAPIVEEAGVRRVQETGRIVGTVTDQRGEPLPATQIQVLGMELGTVSNAEGRYTLENVPAGEVQLRAQRIGYATVNRTITVVANQTVTLDMELRPEALQLDAIVVTGTPGETQRRAIGNTVGHVDMSAAVESAPSQDLQTMISARVPGVTALSGSGNLGTGGQMRIRGISSLSLTNEPLVYVDGVRINADPNAGPSVRGGRQVSRLADINPNDIASIEVIKGPAAATLYGTEASNGVIQIITKRGQDGAPSIDLQVEQGAIYLPGQIVDRFPTNYWVDPDNGQLVSQNLLADEEAAGRPIFQTGHTQKYSLSVRGGSETLRYFISGQLDDADGVLDYNWRKQYGGRINLESTLRDNLTLTTNFGYVHNNVRLAQPANAWDLVAQIVWGTPRQRNLPVRGFLRAPPEDVATIESHAQVGRFLASAQVDFRPWTWFFHRLNFGFDVADEKNSILFPRHPDGDAHFFGGSSLGERTVEHRASTYSSLDYAATASFNVNQDFESATSFGVQYHDKRIEISVAEGRIFPAPSVRTVGGAAITFGSEDMLQNKTLGMYVQERIGWRNRLFVTAALRGDDNSAFGTDFSFVMYPKVSATWVVNEELFWNFDAINTLRLRGAWGQAGQQPDAFAAIRLYGPTTGPGDASTLTPLNVGNPDLKPEVGEEIELGFDAAFAEDRVSMELTWFSKTTRDAILQQRAEPSRGFPGTRFVNLGEVKNWGLELGLNGRVLDRPDFAWDIGGTFATNSSEVTDLGGLPPISTGTLQEHREGYPVGSIFLQRPVSTTVDGDGNITRALCDDGAGGAVDCSDAPRVFSGVPMPKWQTTLNTTVTLFDRVRLFALVDAMGGHHMMDGDIGASHVLIRNSRAIYERTDPILVGYDHLNAWQASGLFDAGFMKLREVSLSYDLPSELASRIGAGGASVSVAGRNMATLWRATDEIFGRKIVDSEMRLTSSEHSAYRQTVMPQFATFQTTVRLTF